MPCSPNMVTLCIDLLKIKIKLKIGVLQIKLGRILDILRAFLIKQLYSTRAGWI